MRSLNIVLIKYTVRASSINRRKRVKEHIELYKLLKERDTVSNQDVRQEREPAVRDCIKM